MLSFIKVIICIVWLSLSPPVPRADLDMPGLQVTLECAMASVVGFSLVLGYIGLLACTCFLLAFLAWKLPDKVNDFNTLSCMTIFLLIHVIQ